MGLSRELAHCTLRFSLGYKTSKQDIAQTLQLLKEVIESSKNIVRFVSCK
jgi:cysteine sulfinate desulfinase/cysteine desulfurase-like protein